MIELLTTIIKLVEKLFGKIIEDIGIRLFKSYSNIFNPKNKPYNKFIELPYIRYGDGRCFYGKCYNLKNRDELLRKQELRIFYSSLNYFSKKALIKKIINDFQIICYNDCDKFIMAIIILFKNITKKNIVKIFKKEMSNSQSVAIMDLLEEIKEIKPRLISKDIKEYLEAREKL